MPLKAQQLGDLDLSFGQDGKVVLLEYDSIISSSAAGPLMVVTQDLKIILAFERWADGSQLIQLIRLNTDGTVDDMWGLGMAVYSDIGRLRDMDIRSDGKLILVGQENGSSTPIKVQRFLPSGILDMDYGTNGTAEIPDPGWDKVQGCHLLPDNKLLVFRKGLIFRLSANGVIDTSFGIDGYYTITSDDGPYDVAVMPNGLIVWTTAPGDGYLSYDGQSSLLPVLTSLGEWGRLFKKIEMNGNGAFLAHSLEPPPFFGGSGSSTGFGHSNGFMLMNFHGFEYLWTSVYTSPISHSSSFGTFFTQATTGPIFTDQAGNFFGAWSVTGTTLISPEPKSWFVRKYHPTNNGTVPHDETFGDYSGPYYLRGLQTIFEPSYLAVSTSGKAQVDGRIVIAGYSDLAEGRRVILARYHNIPDPRSKLHLKMFLGGPYDPVTGTMTDHLRQQFLIPFIQPYSPPDFQPKNGVGSWGLGANVLDQEGDSAVVDWVWLELLDPDPVIEVKATRVGLLHRNGTVSAADGVSPIDFSVGAGAYHLRVRHRNHLSVTLSDPITLGMDPIEIDLTSPATATFGTNAQKEVAGVTVLWPGDATGDGRVKYMGAQNDRDAILIAIGGVVPTAITDGYLKEDVNMDGEVKYVGSGNDRDLVLQTIGGVVPTAVLVEQGPW